MKELLKKESFTKEELQKIEEYFSFGNITELLELDNAKIISLTKKIEDTLGYTLIPNALDSYLSMESIEISCLFEEEEITKYIKYLELMDYYNISDFGIGFSIADYYLENGNKELALLHYKEYFKEGFDLSQSGYYYALERYLSITDDEPKNVLIKLVDSAPKDYSQSNDYVNTILLLISKLEKFSTEYLKYINLGIKVATPIVRKYQEHTSECGGYFFSDSDEERNLCELLALKMEYYVNKKNYIQTYELYKELTDEIHRSDCTRYYHARDLFYKQMLKDMSEEYPELKFLLDMSYKAFRILGVPKFIEEELITLINGEGLTFDFKIKYIYDKVSISIVPILPLLGEGGIIFTELSQEHVAFYLTTTSY